MTGDAARPGGEAHACCRGENNPTGKRSKLHLDSGSDVRKPGRVSTVNRTEIVGQIDEEFSAMGYPQPNSRIRAVDASRGAGRGQIDPILCLQAAGRDDKARVGYIRPISLDLALGTRAIFCGQGRSNFSPEPSEQKGKNQPGPNGIYDSQLTALPWAKNRAKARAPSPKWVLRLGRRPYWVPRTKAVTLPPRRAA